MAEVDAELWQQVQGGTVTSVVSEKIEQATDELQETREGLVRLRDRMKEATRGLDQEIARIDRMLKAAGAAPPRKTSGTSKVKVSAETVEMVLGTINEIPPGHSLSVVEIANAVGKTRSSVQTAVTELRRAERIRLVGERQQEGHGGRGPRLYAPMTQGSSDGDHD